MKNQLIAFIEKIQNSSDILIYDEAATKQTIILPILNIIGWNVFSRNEVFPEYVSGRKRVDYSLLINGSKVFIEAKRPSESLENHTEQLLTYSFQEGVSLAILTNGISWWFYLPLNESNWEERKFLTIEINEQSSDEISSRFIEFLARQNVESGKAVSDAKKLSESEQRKSKIKKTLPIAWNKIISEPDELFVEILSETTEKLCGFKPSNDILDDFLKSLKSKCSLKQEQRGGDGNIKPPNTHVNGKKFLLKYKGLSAIGINNGSSITILKGSQASTTVLDSLQPHYIVKRNNLIVNGILAKNDDCFVFEQNYFFESFSSAASIICGSSRNGRKDFIETHERV